MLGVAISLKTVQIKAAQPRLRGLLHSVWRESHCGVKQWLDYGGCDLQVLLHYSYESKRYCDYVCKLLGQWTGYLLDKGGRLFENQEFSYANFGHI